MNQESARHCENCGSVNLQRGILEGHHKIGFWPDNAKLSDGILTIRAIVCKDCGCIFNLRLAKPDELK